MSDPAPQLEPDLLADVVGRMLAAPSPALDHWQIQPLNVANLSPDSRALYRIAGTAQTRDGPRDWSLILKTLKAPTAGRDNPGHLLYWRREALAYQSGLLKATPNGLRAPVCYSVTQPDQMRSWLWIEDLGTPTGTPWSLAHYGRAARRLGAFSGQTFAIDRAAAPWLNTGVLSSWIADSAGLIRRIQQPGIWDHPLLKPAFPRPLTAPILALWQERTALCAALERLPRTICHHDLWRNNLFAWPSDDDDRQTVVIDWELIGWGAPGEDAGNLFAVSLLNFDVEAAQASALEQHIFQGYLEGLHLAGWRGSPDAVRAAFVTAAVLRCIFSTACWPVTIVHDATGRAMRETEERWQRPIDHIFQQWAAVTELLFVRADEMRRLLHAPR